jgi:hypothetical protein
MTPRTPRSRTSRRALLTWWAASVGAFVAATLMATGPLHAAVPAPAFDAAFQQFQQASARGEAKTIEAAAEQFGRLAAAAPGDPVLLAYSGAATTMRATTTMLPWRKLAHADEGLAQIDKALALLASGHDMPLYRNVPASLETRFVAASTFLRLPAMFNRQARGARLLDEVVKSPLLAAAPEGFRAAVARRAADEAAKARP